MKNKLPKGFVEFTDSEEHSRVLVRAECVLGILENEEGTVVVFQQNEESIPGRITESYDKAVRLLAEAYLEGAR